MEYINAFCVAWTLFSLVIGVWALVDALRHRRPTRRTPPRYPTPPLKPFSGRLVPDVKVRPMAVHQTTKQQQWLDDWRRQNSLVANPHIGDEYRSIIRLDERRKVSVK